MIKDLKQFNQLEKFECQINDMIDYFNKNYNEDYENERENFCLEILIRYLHNTLDTLDALERINYNRFLKR